MDVVDCAQWSEERLLKAEVGAAWGCGVRVFGLWAKCEPAGLMRHMVVWFTNFRELMDAI